MPRKRRLFVNPDDALKELGKLDQVFIIDTTASMQPFLDNAKRYIRELAEETAQANDLDLSYCVIEYRDHPPQDRSFVVKNRGFGDDKQLQSDLDALRAEGGGDDPEAMYDAVIEAAVLTYRPGADRIALLVADSPPHNPCLCGLNPLKVIDACAKANVILNACSIAGSKITESAMRELTDALGGYTTTVQSAKAAVEYTSDTFLKTAGDVGRARAYYSAAVSLGVSDDFAGATAVAAKLGWDEKTAAESAIYLRRRGTMAPAKKK